MSKEIKKKRAPEKIDWMDVEALAAAMCGKNSDVDERSDVESAFYGKFAVELDAFESIVEVLWPMLDFGISPLTDTPFIGFSEQKGKGKQWIIHRDISHQFISGVIQWLGGHEIKKGEKGRLRDITSKGEIEYKITITKP